MPNAIFISYRRDDSEGEAGRLFDDLSRVFGPENVFMDVAGIKPGADFRRVIEEGVAQCGVLLAVVGPMWAAIANANGERRLQDPNDFVVLEVGSALRRNVPVIPVLVHAARMPSAEQLPAALKDFCYRNSVELAHARWNSDVQLLIEALKAYVEPSRSIDRQPVHATLPVQLPTPHQPEAGVSPKRSRSRSILLFALGLAGLIIAGILAWAFWPGGEPSLTGVWADPSTRPGNNLSRLVIAGSGNDLSMHAFGSCEPVECDWGTESATAGGDGVNAMYTIPGSKVSRTAVITAKRDGENLDVLIHNIFIDSEGQQTSTQVRRSFVHP